MSRSFHMLTRQQAAAFDFDVVTDVQAEPKPMPQPDVARDSAPKEPIVPREPAEA